MKLCRILIDGFRNINMTEIEFNGMVALVSLNSYGKSNLLQAIDFGVDYISENADNKRKMMSWSKGIPLNKSMASKDFRIEFEMTVKLDSETFRIVYGYQFRWVRDDETGACIVAEWLKAKHDEKNQKYNMLIDRNMNKAFYRSSETGRCNNKITIEDNELVINKLIAYESIYYYNFIKVINKLSVYVERHLDASQSYTPDPIVRKNVEALEMEGAGNLPRTIYHLKKQHPEKFELLINAFMQLFPQISEINVEELAFNFLDTNLPKDLPFTLNKKVYALYVNDNNLNQPISLEDMSDGVKRVFLLLTYLVIAEINNYSLIAVEEPENSIHPSLLQNYLRVLAQLLGENTKIIITSHSPYIIQYMEPNNIYLGLPGNHGVAQFRRIKKLAQKALMNNASKLEMSVGDYLFELLSGAEEEIKILDRYLEYGHE